MPSMTADGQSLMIDGRRVWLVSGTIPYARIPRDLWRQRLLQARSAGLNCIVTPVVWSRHEPMAGGFVFDGDLDLAHFVRLIAELDMYCLLQAGPYIGPSWDLGGLPAWLLADVDAGLRSSNPAFMAACSRYFGALCAQVRGLQVTTARGEHSGSIAMFQCEDRWLCADEAQGLAYFRELDRFLRENGITVPIFNTNNLFYSPEGQIGAWAGADHLHATVRQLRAVEPDHPPLVVLPAGGGHQVWGRPESTGITPAQTMRQIAEVLAGGGQPILDPFHAPPALEFGGGRLTDGPDAFIATRPDADPPLGPAGQQGDRFNAVRRICMFASSFGRVFAAFEPTYQPVIRSLEPDEGEATTSKPLAVCPHITASEARGSQGSVVFIFSRVQRGRSPVRTTLTLGDGSSLPVTIGSDPVMWVLRNTHLAGRATLDYCNLSIVALVGHVLVCYGPSGAAGVISINGTELSVRVPGGAAPLIEQHEGITIVVCNESSVDRMWVANDRVHLGAMRIDEQDRPVRSSGGKPIKTLDADGKKIKVDVVHEPARSPRINIRGWSVVRCDDYIDGSAVRFATIDGPATMEQLGVARGYGWFRLRFKSKTAHKVRAGLVEASDRLHLYLDGSLAALAGVGPGAIGHIVDLQLEKREHTLTVLADNWGRLSEGDALGERKGLYGHLWQLSPFRAGAATIETAAPLRPLEVRSPIFGLDPSDQTDSARLTWAFIHRRHTPIILMIDAFPACGLVLLNGEPVHVLTPGSTNRLVLSSEQLRRGKNVVQIAMVGDMRESAPAIKKGAALYEGIACLSDAANWAFAIWEPPADSEFEPIQKSKMTAQSLAQFRGRPVWWRGLFSAERTDASLLLDATGLSKGQLFLNGRNLARYFVSTHTGKGVPPQSVYDLPTPWLRTDKPNELVIFDEHGCAPNKVRIAYGSPAP